MNDITLLNQDQCYFSDNTPNAVKLLLETASKSQDKNEKERLLRQAIDQYPEQLDPYIALYKFYFRTAQYKNAERQIWKTLKRAAELGNFSRNYRLLTQQSADWLDDHSVSRLYLFSLKALGVVRLRQGKVRQANWVLTKLLKLDPNDEIGGSNFLAIAEQFLEDEAA